MVEGVIFGIIQGIAEWLPVSSEGVIVLVRSNFFAGSGITDMIRFALFLHLGTFFAALAYFWRDVIALGKHENRETLYFLAVSTVVSGILGYILFYYISHIPVFSARIVTFATGIMLLITAGFQFLAKGSIKKTSQSIGVFDGILLGIVQGFAVLPGLSRSGLTISALLLRKYDETLSLKLSFLMSLPIVLAGNIALNFRAFAVTSEALWGLLFSFLFGLGAIHALLRVSEKINFGYFVLLFAALMIASVAFIL